jgi:N-acetylneuraminic acid mutarotase
MARTRSLASLAALAALPALAHAGDAELTYTNGVLGSQLNLSADGDAFQPFALLISFNQGPTPVGLIDPGDPGLLQVGIDLLDFLFVGFLPQTAVFPLPSSPSLQGLVLNSQFLTLFSPTDGSFVDELSNPCRLTLGANGTSSETLATNFVGRQGHTLTTSADGTTAYVLGGTTPTGPSTTTTFGSGERYVAETQSFELLPNALTGPRTVHTATRLDDGRILIVGGSDVTETVVSACEIFDPATGTSTPVAPMSRARTQHTATKLADGRVLVVGGGSVFDLSDPLGSLASATSSSEIYNPSTNTWTSGPNLPAATVGHTATLLDNGKVLIVGGVQVSIVFGAPLPSISNVARLYDPASNSFQSVPNLPVARVYHGAVSLPGNQALVYGGADGSFITLSFSPLGTSYRFDGNSNSWIAVGNLVTPRAYAAGNYLASSNGVVIGGGLVSIDVAAGTGTPATSYERFDLGTNAWSTTAAGIKGRAVSLTVPVDNGVRLLTVGGTQIAGSDLVGPEAELMIP